MEVEEEEEEEEGGGDSTVGVEEVDDDDDNDDEKDDDEDELNMKLEVESGLSELKNNDVRVNLGQEELCTFVKRL